MFACSCACFLACVRTRLSTASSQIAKEVILLPERESKTNKSIVDRFSSGEEMKFKAENLGEPPEKEEPIDANWLRRGVQEPGRGIEVTVRPSVPLQPWRKLG